MTDIRTEPRAARPRPADAPVTPQPPYDAHDAEGATDAAASEAGKERSSRLRRIILAAVLLVAAGLGLVRWLTTRNIVSTDNAQVDGHITPIAPKVQAFVARVLVDDNRTVKAGETLVVLDDKDLQLRLRQAEADLAQARAQAGGRAETGQAAAQLGTARAQAAGATSSIAAAEARFRQAEADLARYRSLAANKVISAQQLDQAQTAYEQAQANLEAARRTAAAAESQVSAASAGIRGADARLAAAQAAVETARVNVGYTVLLAPIDGVVARRRVEPGELVQPGQALMSIVPTTDLWVTANLKETQLADVTPGDKVTFEVDTYKGVEFEGTVESVSPATGARFALLPPDNATGNYTKVVQRVPVRIAVDASRDAAHPLRPGLSAVVKIRAR